MGITETSWLDQEGKVLETQVGGFFIARLEPEAQAKRLDYVQDLLVSAVVKPPKPIRHSVVLDNLELLMDGFGETLPPTSWRQKVHAENGKVRLKLRRDTPIKGKLESFSGTKMQEFLEATPFVQSSNKELVKTAYEIYKNKLNIQFIHIKAHTNNTDIHSFGNDNADKLANIAIGLDNCPYNTSGKTKIYLMVPFTKKDELKKLGGIWDSHNKKWFIYDNHKNIDKILTLFSKE